MTQECPFCKMTDLPQGAVRCCHCGSWLDGRTEQERTGALERQIREDFASNAKEYRETLTGFLSQLRWAGGVIVALALGAAVYFGWRTDQSIATTTDQIAEDARVQIAESVGMKVEEAVDERMSSQEVADMIEATIRTTVETKVDEAIDTRFADISDRVQTKLEASEAQLAGVTDDIDSLRRLAEEAKDRINMVTASFQSAQNQTVASSQSILPLAPVVAEEKAGLDQLRHLLASPEPVNALTFWLGGYYSGAFVWKYVEELRTRPEFAFVVVYNRDDTVFGAYDVEALRRDRNPREHGELAAASREDFYYLPDAQQVPKWRDFAQWIRENSRDELARIASFVPVEQMVRKDETSLEALERLDSRSADRMLALDANGRLAGIVDRARLTTRVLVELAR